MKTKSAVIILLFTALFACIGSTENINDNKTFIIDIENCKTSIDLKLSDLIESCRLVPLETTSESLLSNRIRYIYLNDDFIIIDDDKGIYKFTSEGKFIKKIINVGRGPNELSNTLVFYYDEKKDILFINDIYGHKDNFLRYDVKKDSFLTPIKKCFSNYWDFTLYKDSLILGSVEDFRAGSNPYALFIQDFNGNFVSGIQSKRKFVFLKSQNENLQRMLIYTDGQQIHVKYTFDDTVFTFNDNKLSPYLIPSSNSAKSDPPATVPNNGETRSYFDKYENSSFMIFYSSTFKGEIQNNYGAAADYSHNYYFIDKSNGKHWKILSYTDDLIGKTQISKGQFMTFPTSLSNNRLYTLYYPQDLLHKTSKKSDLKSLSTSLYDQLTKIKNTTKETDNPILLVGKPRENIVH